MDYVALGGCGVRFGPLSEAGMPFCHRCTMPWAAKSVTVELSVSPFDYVEASVRMAASPLNYGTSPLSYALSPFHYGRAGHRHRTLALAETHARP